MADNEAISSGLTRRPDVNVAAFAFLLNYPWEFLQMPLYEGAATAALWPTIVMCSLATVGDAVVMTIAYWLTTFGVRSPTWVLEPRRKSVALFLLVGLIITLVLEFVAIRVPWGWTYAPSMPRLPLLGAGLTPVLQWLVLPPVVLWIVRRQLYGAAAIAAKE
jgi:hypothetical protein